jgi:hypothetical protein
MACTGPQHERGRCPVADTIAIDELTFLLTSSKNPIYQILLVINQSNTWRSKTCNALQSIKKGTSHINVEVVNWIKTILQVSVTNDRIISTEKQMFTHLGWSRFTPFKWTHIKKSRILYPISHPLFVLRSASYSANETGNLIRLYNTGWMLSVCVLTSPIFKGK